MVSLSRRFFKLRRQCPLPMVLPHLILRRSYKLRPHMGLPGRSYASSLLRRSSGSHGVPPSTHLTRRRRRVLSTARTSAPHVLCSTCSRLPRPLVSSPRTSKAPLLAHATPSQRPCDRTRLLRSRPSLAPAPSVARYNGVPCRTAKP